MASRVAIVGHGPSGEGGGNGAKIDCCDFVVRMANCDWQYVADYGSRYDFGLFCPPMGRHTRFPELCWWIYDASNRDDGSILGKRLFHLPWLVRARSMGAQAESRVLKLTRGCAAVCAAIELLKPEELMLIGMDMLQSGRTPDVHYGPAAQSDFDVSMADRPFDYQPGMTREGAHDHGVERSLVVAMAAENNIKLNWNACSIS